MLRIATVWNWDEIGLVDGTRYPRVLNEDNYTSPISHFLFDAFAKKSAEWLTTPCPLEQVVVPLAVSLIHLGIEQPLRKNADIRIAIISGVTSPYLIMLHKRAVDKMWAARARGAFCFPRKTTKQQFDTRPTVLRFNIVVISHAG